MGDEGPRDRLGTWTFHRMLGGNNVSTIMHVSRVEGRSMTLRRRIGELGLPYLLSS